MLSITIVLVLFLLAFEILLLSLNYAHRNQPIPKNVADVYKPEAYKQWHNYTMENFRLDIYSKIANAILIVAFLSLSVFPMISDFSKSITSSSVFEPILFLGIYFMIDYILDLGFTTYKTFHIEEKYGFNKTTVKTFVFDQIKFILLMGSLAFGVLSFVFVMYQRLGNISLIYTWLLIISIMLLISILYTRLFIKLFYTLTPLPKGELYNKAMTLANELGYEIKEISVMDASKRSSKLNAFFTGFGRFKSIVLYDTLLDKCSTDEIVSVLAHEIGHSIHKDTLRSTFETFIEFGIYISILSVFLSNPHIFTSFGFIGVHMGFALILFSIYVRPIHKIINIPINALSRKAEYRADKCAADSGYNEALINALKVLSRENFSNLTPHPLMVKMTYSHPTTSQRLAALEKL